MVGALNIELRVVDRGNAPPFQQELPTGSCRFAWVVTSHTSTTVFLHTNRNVDAPSLVVKVASPVPKPLVVVLPMSRYV